MVTEVQALSATPMVQNRGLCIYLLGPMRIEQDSLPIRLPRRKVESLLAFLILRPEQHLRDHLATLFWGDSSDTQARHSLRTALATVRQLVSTELLLADREHVQLNPSFPLWVDLYQLLGLEKLVDHASGELPLADLDLWQGELLAGFYDEWVTAEREHYGTRLLKLFLQVTQALRAASEYTQAIAVAQRVLALDPANEHAHQHLMFCYVAAGDRPAALRQYELCERVLADELDVSPMPETTALYEWIKQRDSEDSSPASKITNLPIPLTSFVGRTHESAEVKRLLTPSRINNRQPEKNKKSDLRVLTLTGAGGSGKTRLAIQVATDLIDSFAHGVWWVELAALSDDDLVGRAVAKTLGVREKSDQPLSQSVAKFVGDKQMLLVIDNCEHLIEPSAHFAAELLGSCPNLQILATSREPLNIAGETLWQVPTFSVPEATQLGLAGLMMQFEGVRLFVERARTVQPDFTLTVENAQAVAEICQRLDGIPLAIELAAARVKVLSVEQIAAYLTGALGARFNLLTQGNRTVLPRHQTLRATIDWGYALLDEEERRLFRQMAVFRGGFTLEILEELVASISNDARSSLPNILDLLTQLVDKSFVIVERHGGQNRYRILETLREYGLEKFPSSDELARLQQQHAEVFLHLADRAEVELVRAQQHTWLNRLEDEHANLRAALDHLITQGEGEGALRLARALSRFWYYRGYISEGRDWLKAALAIRGSAADTTIVAKALNAAGRLAFRQGDFDYALEVHKEALFLFEQAEEEIGIGDSLLSISIIEMDQGDYITAKKRMDISLEIFRSHDYKPGIAQALTRLSNLAWDQDRFADARDFHLESLKIYRSLDMQLSVASETLGLGDNERMLGHLDVACDYYQECLRIARNLGHKGLVGAALKSLGMLAIRQKDYEKARQYTEESLQIFRVQGDRVQVAWAYSSLGHVARHLDETNEALSYYSQCLQIMYEVGFKWPIFAALEDIADVLSKANQLPEVAARFMGMVDTLRQETDIAIAPNQEAMYERISTFLRQSLDDEMIAKLRQEGQTTPLAQIVAEAIKLRVP